MSSSEATKKQESLVNLDGFDSYTDEAEGEDLSTARGIIQGTKLSYTLQATWETPDGQEVKDELVAVDVWRGIQKWSRDNKPLDVITLGPGERFPDIAQMNERTPRNEWRTDFNGNPCGPWVGTHAVFFVNPATMEKYTWPSQITTIGSARCVRDLTDQVRTMRKFRGAPVYPVVELSHTHMPTRFGGRERPVLTIKRWITFGSSGGMLPAPDTPALTEVKSPSRQEQLDDSIPF